MTTSANKPGTAITGPQPVVAYYMGLDLGKKQDYTALSIIQAGLGTRERGQYGQVITRMAEPDEVVYTVTWLERFKLGLSYPEMIEACVKRYRAIDTAGQGLPGQAHAHKMLAVDATGVGGPVVDLLRKTGLNPLAITITGGDKASHEGQDYRVPKRDLVTCVQVLQQQRRLKVSPGLVEGATLVREMQSFSYKISEVGHDSYGSWREGSHDDLTLSVACALWVARNASGRPFTALVGGPRVPVSQQQVRPGETGNEPARPTAGLDRCGPGVCLGADRQVRPGHAVTAGRRQSPAGGDAGGKRQGVGHNA